MYLAKNRPSWNVDVFNHSFWKLYIKIINDLDPGLNLPELSSHQKKMGERLGLGLGIGLAPARFSHFVLHLFTVFYLFTLHHQLGAWNRLGLLLLMISSPIPRWKNTNTTTGDSCLWTVSWECPGREKRVGVGWDSPPVPFSSHFFSVWIPLSLCFLAFSSYLSLVREPVYVCLTIAVF